MADGASIQGLFAGKSSVDHVFLPAGELRPDSAECSPATSAGCKSVLNVRLLGVAHVVRAAKPLMKGGSITLMSGLYATRPAAGGALAAAAVAAVNGITGLWHWTLRRSASTRSPPADRYPALGCLRPSARRYPFERGQAPVGRVGQPEEIRGGDLPDEQRVRHRSCPADRRRWWRSGLTASCFFHVASTMFQSNRLLEFPGFSGGIPS